ncbi:hypothetical protein [Streptomyces sp. G7(2002)]|uniref:hypothetical protein n=1 Tax=Streptomyces sp. G7(2002) TaxID=2971798 RepID=UPI00237DEF0F|nr:hypothetical protein [Streptomyces sp. G7(2002)]WDT53516.1 hypothetical protein NUT86_05355 [Streptomyces sp. G7(2002)]
MTDADHREVDPRHTDATPCAEATEALHALDLHCVEVPNTSDALSHLFAHLLH